MSDAGTSTPTVQGLLSGVQSAVTTGLAASLPTYIQQLTADGLGLLGDTAQNFDTMIVNMIQDVEAGSTWGAAWTKESAVFETTEKTELLQIGLDAVQKTAAFFDGIFNAATSAI